MAERQQAHFPSIFDTDSDDDSDPDEVYKKLNRDDTGPSLVPLNVSLARISHARSQCTRLIGSLALGAPCILYCRRV